MKIVRLIQTGPGLLTEVEIGLNPKELRLAYNEQQHNYDLSDIDNEIDFMYDDLDEEFRIGENPVTDAEKEEMANLLRHKLDRDCDASFTVCKAEAINEVLRKRGAEDDTD